ncbi:vegetative cell wall protein gp1-like [Durio zibethinus]|uniref:Vegetative cell wall protein gp1-like n=1 Tax=Durio zibethinus TaxID=66656 RepID=A0A6P6A8V6_DURZI|nr:vegetative cell wall protein gp1-like [Durio zibethinus]
MEPKSNKTLLVFLVWCIILFNPAQAICVPRNRSDAVPSSFASSLKLQPPPSHVYTPISQPPPSPPAPRTTSAPVPPTPPKSQSSASSPRASKASTSLPSTSSASAPVPPMPPQETPDSSPDLSSLKSKLPTIQISLPIVSLNSGAGSKIVSDPEIKSLCGKTDQPALCLATISPFFNGKTDLASVIGMLIKAGIEQTKQAIATAAKMATDPKYSNPKTLSKLNDCKEIYDDALDNMQEAIEAIPLKDVGTIETMISAAISDYGTCDDGFTGQPNPIPEGVSPMAKINENLMNIAGVILALTKMMP